MSVGECVTCFVGDQTNNNRKDKQFDKQQFGKNNFSVHYQVRQSEAQSTPVWPVLFCLGSLVGWFALSQLGDHHHQGHLILVSCTFSELHFPSRFFLHNQIAGDKKIYHFIFCTMISELIFCTFSCTMRCQKWGNPSALFLGAWHAMNFCNKKKKISSRNSLEPVMK